MLIKKKNFSILRFDENTKPYLKDNSKKNLHKHPFHLVKPSKWPLCTAFCLLLLTLSAAAWMHGVICPIPFFINNGINSSLTIMLFSFLVLLFCLWRWWKDIIKETEVEKYHTSYVRKGLLIAFILFLASEIMFFAAFFWAYFHSSISPEVSSGGVFPPKGIEVFSPWGVPLANTLILLTSGATVTWAHHAFTCVTFKNNIINNKKFLITAGHGLALTVVLGLIFTSLQIYEYVHAKFTIADSVYGSVFFLATGFHGLHVLIGTIMLSVAGVRISKMRKKNYKQEFMPYVNLRFAVWYWHFVDIIWLFLYVSIYWWGI